MARIRVMKTDLIQKEEYQRLLKMTDTEVLNFLQSTQYRQDVDSVAVKDLDDAEIIDTILASNARRTVKKLERISRREFTEALQPVLRQNDMWNLTIVAEAITGKSDIKDALTRLGKHGTIPAAKYYDVTSLKELAQLAKLPPVATLHDFLHVVAQQTFTGNTRADAYLIDEHNLMTLVRFTREELGAEKLKKYIVLGGTLSRGLLVEAAQGDLASVFQALRKTKYGAVMERALEYLEHGSVARFEDDLHRDVTRKIRRVAHAHPLGTDVLIHYLAAKEIEHENLRVLIKGKRLGMSEKFINTYVI